MRKDNYLTESYWPADTTEDLLEVTAGDLLRQIAEESPDRIALVDGVIDPSKRRRWTYSQLLSIAERTARALLRDFSPGDRIAVCAPNCAEWVLLQYGLNLAGLVLVPINPAYKKNEIEVIVRDAEVAGIFYAAEFRGNDIESIVTLLVSSVSTLKKAVLISQFDAFIKHTDPLSLLPKIGLNDLLQIQYTSGTSGVPKGACLHHVGTLNTSRFVAQRAGFPVGGVWLNAMPLYHVGGSVVTELGTLALRGTYVIAPHFEPALMLELIESEKINASLFVPTMIIALLDDPEFSQRDHSSMKVVLTGASVVPATLVRRTKAAFGCSLVILFGQTEVNGVVCQTTPDDSVDDQAHTLGRPLPQIELRIADPETGTTQAIEVPGEICVRGYQVMHGYCGYPTDGIGVIDNEGWLYTGDLGAIDSRGYVRITGRLKDMIIRGGMNIYPREIEDILFDHAEVADVSVVGVPDEKWGEIIAAVIRPLDHGKPPSPDELHAYCRSRMAAHKAPSLWFFVESYPLTPSGKIQKYILRSWISEGVLAPVSWSRSSVGVVVRAEVKTAGDE